MSTSNFRETVGFMFLQFLRKTVTFVFIVSKFSFLPFMFNVTESDKKVVYLSSP